MITKNFTHLQLNLKSTPEMIHIPGYDAAVIYIWQSTYLRLHDDFDNEITYSVVAVT